MRLVLALLALFALSAAAPVDRSTTMVATPEGGFRMGSATAPVKLVEYGSLTCPHCREFHLESTVVLKRDYVAKGLVSYEFRNILLNGPDYAVSMLARCDGPAAFFRRVDLFFRDQPVWIAPFTTLTEADSQRIGALPQDQQLAAIALAGKLDAYVAKAGMTRARFDQCLANTAQSDLLEKVGKLGAQQGVRATPTFFINGRSVGSHTWVSLEPLLRSALKLKPKAK